MPKTAKRILKVDAYVIKPTHYGAAEFLGVSLMQPYKVVLKSTLTYKGKKVTEHEPLPLVYLSAHYDIVPIQLTVDNPCCFPVDQIHKHNGHLTNFVSVEAANEYIELVKIRIHMALDSHNSLDK